MKILYISGSPRKESNTDYLLRRVQEEAHGEFIKLTDYSIEPCNSCWGCVESGSCALDDDMRNTITPKLLSADVLVIGTPVYFNNVTAQLKAFIDRTWAFRGRLRNKIGAAVVVGRKYGAESAITAINAFFLKHEMIVANRGVSGMGFRSGSVSDDAESLRAAAKLASRILELGSQSILA